MKLKKLLSVFVSLALLLSLISVPVFADGNNVAQIGDTEYATLADAIAAVPTDGTQTTITMIANETIENVGQVGITVAANKNIVLDLNGKTISGVSSLKSTRFIDNKGTLEITDSSANEDGKITFCAVADTGYSVENITIYNIGGNLTLIKGTIENTTAGGLTYAVNTSSNAWGTGDDKYSEFTMTGGRLAGANTDNTLRVYQNCAAGDVASHNTVSISGGVIDNGIFVDTYLYTENINVTNYTGANIDTEINISGGTVNGLIDLKIRHPFNTVLNITDGDFTNAKLQVRKHGEYNTNFSEPTEPMVNIAGGCFAFADAGKAFLMAYDSTTSSWSTYEKAYEITGGKYSADPSAYVAEGYNVVDNTDDDAATYPYVIGEAVTYVAKIGDVKYASLEEAITAAQSGDTITLLNDVTVNTGSSSSSRFAISKSMTIDGNGHTISINNRGFGVGMNATSDIDVTFKDVTITNSTNAGRCVDTRGHINSLTLDNVVLATTGTSGYLQPLTIGGNQSTVAEINIVNSTIKTSEDGSKGYAIITFNPVDMTITDSTIKGWACVYAKGPDGSAGSDGSVFTVNNSTLVSKNVYSGKTNAFSMFMFEDDDVTVNVTDSILNVSSTGDQYQSIGSIQPNSGLTDVEVNLGEGNVVTMTGEMTAFATNYPCVNITGGTYNVDPTYYVAEDYVAIDNNDGTWTVSPIAYVAQVGTVKYTSLEEALAAAPDGATVELLADISIDATLTIDKNLTINGNNNTITAVKSTGYYAIEVVDGAAAAPIAVSINDLTLNTTGFQVGILPNADYGIDLTLTNVDIDTDGAAVYANGYSVAKIIDCDLTRSGKYVAGKDAVYYSVLNVGYGGQIEMTNGTVTANGGNGVGTFPSGGSVTLTNVDVTVEDNDDFTANHALWARNEDQTSYPEYCRDSVIVVKSGNVSGDFFITDKYPTGHNKNMYEVVISITGGTFDNYPSAYVAKGYEAVDNGDDTWTVGEVKAGDLVEAEQANDGYDATYTVKKQVVANDTTIAQGTERTVNVNVVDAIDSEVKAVASSEDTTPAEIIENLDMDKVLANVVASVDDSDKTIDVDVQVVRDKPDLDESTNTITYEVHPEVIVTVNGVAADPVVVSNDALDENASFTITLPVPDTLAALAVNGKIRVIHRSEGSEPEVLFHEVLGDAGNYYIQFNVSHFSEFELGLPLFTGHSISLEGYVDLNFFLNLSEAQVTTGTGTVVDFTWARGSTSYQIKTTDFVEGKGYKATVKLPAAEMNYQINAKVTINGALQTETNSYSVREYCDEILDSDSAFSVAYVDAYGTDKYNSLVYLVKTMLDYGAKAQVAFGRTDVDLANAGVDYTMPDASRNDLLDAINTAIYEANGRYADNMLTVASNIGANGYYSSSLIYLSGCTLRHYFVGPGLDASKYTGVKSGYYYYVDKANIAAADLDTLQEFQVGDETFYYSALDFAKAIIYNYADGSNYDLAAATYWYNQAANAYFE